MISVPYKWKDWRFNSFISEKPKKPKPILSPIPAPDNIFLESARIVFKLEHVDEKLAAHQVI